MHRPQTLAREDVLFLGLAFACIAAIGCTKVVAALHWRYSSDLFAFLQYGTELAAGHTGLDYTYGNPLGDHAYLWLPLLGPLVWLLGKHALWVLLLAPPLMFGASNIVLYRWLRQRLSPSAAVMLGLPYLFHGHVAEGLFEDRWGFHPDNLAGSLLVILAVTLLPPSNAREAGAPQAMPGAAWLALCAFLLLKEEMVLLAALFFLVRALLQHNRFDWVMGTSCLALFVGELLAIHALQTPFNRSNAHLLSETWITLTTHGEQVIAEIPSAFTLFVLSSVLLMTGIRRLSAQPNATALALFTTGLAKFAFGLAVMDPDLSSWHCYPGIAIVTAALVIQLGLNADCAWQPRVCGFMAATSVLCFLAVEAPFLAAQLGQSLRLREQVQLHRAEMQEMKALIDPARVTALTGSALFDWRDGSRFSTYPRGAWYSPLGIADFVLVEPGNLTTVRAEFPAPSVSETQFALATSALLEPEFALLARGPHYALFRRVALVPESAHQRREWIARFGAASIGQPGPEMPYPIAPSRVR